MTSDELLKRLDDMCGCNIDSSPCGAEEECRTTMEAAARIRELEAERDEAVTQMVEAKVERDKAQDRIRELEAENARLNAAYEILMTGFLDELDSHDAVDLAILCKKGDPVRWSEFPPAARKLVEPILAKLHAAQPEPSD